MGPLSKLVRPRRHLTMRTLAWQAVLPLVVLACSAPAAVAQEPAAASYARQLADECDALIELAVKRPYGWGWTDTLEHDPRDRKPVVSMRPGGSPAAGLVLLRAGALLDEPRYIAAGVNVARGVAAAQRPNGSILSAPTFATAAGGVEPPSPVPNRGATRAGIGLLLASLGAEPARDEMFRRSAIRAATWLGRQQADDGGWASPAPADAPEGAPARLIRLDRRAFRDDTLALLLAGVAADDAAAIRRARRSVEKLTHLQLTLPGRLHGLWSTFYRLDGTLLENVSDWPAGVDVLASRCAGETLLAAALLDWNDAARHAARDAARALSDLREDDGTWQRIYPLRGILPAAAPSPFGNDIAPRDDPAIRGDFGVFAFIAAATLVQKIGADEFLTELSRSATLHERIAMVLCGLSDEVFVAHRSEIPAAMDSPEPQGDGTSLEQRVQRLEWLLARARLESQRKLGNP